MLLQPIPPSISFLANLFPTFTRSNVRLTFVGKIYIVDGAVAGTLGYTSHAEVGVAQ